jgi:hypothetical protein
MKKALRILVAILPILSMVFGMLIFVLGCGMSSLPVALFGALFVFLGVAILASRKWEAEEKQ